MARDINQGIDPSMQYLSGGFRGNGVDSTLSRMLGQDVKAKAQFCAECGEKTEIAYKDPKNANAIEVYCKTHYEQLFASKCSGCNQPIMGQYVNANGEKYHPQCFSQDIQCAECSQRVFGEVLTACNKNWHPKCFKCNNCHTLLGHDFMEKGGYPFCKKCSAELSKVTPVVTKTKVNSAHVAETNKQNQELASNVQKGKMFCAECGQSIGAFDEAVSLGPSTFHSACLVCTKCKAALASTGYKEVSGMPYCPSCAGVSGGSGGFCAGCGQKLSGQYLSAMGQKWHKECFVCTSCQKPFNGGYAEKDGMPYCGPCLQKGSKPTYTTVQKGERVGFTVDPRTGQKKYTVGGPQN